MARIMVVDDEEKVALGIAEILRREGYRVATFTSAMTAIKTLELVGDVDLILTDIRMPAVDGTELLNFAVNRSKPIPVIVFTGYGDVEMAVRVMKLGASDFLCKPISREELLIRVKQVLEKKRLAEEVNNLKRRLETSEAFFSIVGRSKAMQEVYELINAVADTDTTVLIRGETGTGKELVARAIHCAGHRRDKPFVAINCTALQHTLLESELFGHEKGAFTGAYALKKGKLEEAQEGTVFLDEIGDTSSEIQAKLLRVLQEREFERLGGNRPIKLRARIIAATNRDLEEAVRAGRFREDLYYRLNVIPIHIPPLREREEDILLLANHFLNVFKKRYNREIEGFSPSAVEQLLEYKWPGNVRELMNAIERTVLITQKRWIMKIAGLGSTEGPVNIYTDLPGKLPFLKARELAIQELEKTYLIHYMREEKGRIKKVAERMGVSVRTVSRQLKRYGLDKRFFKD